jgi:hypothetical protein
MSWLVYVVIVAVLLLLFLKAKLESSIQNRKNNQYEYQPNKVVLSEAELKFFTFLNNEIDSKLFNISIKIRMADVFSVKPKSQNQFGAFNKIKSKHFDFAIINKHNGVLLCLIELDDKSHNKLAAKKNDDFKDNVCKQHGVKLIRIKVKANYNIEEIEKAMSEPV